MLFYVAITIHRLVEVYNFDHAITLLCYRDSHLSNTTIFSDI